MRQRCEACPKTLAHGEDYILYAVLDFIVDDYRPVIETIRAEVEAIEDGVLQSTLASAQVERLYHLRRDLLRLRGAVVPLVDVCRRLEHAEVLPIDPEMQPLFRDVTDHVHRVAEEIESLARGPGLRLRGEPDDGPRAADGNDAAARRLGRILAVQTAIAGIYGMNFEHMPELHGATATSRVLAAIALICGGLYWRFRRNRWL